MPELIGLGGVARVRAFDLAARNAFYAPVWALSVADPTNPSDEEKAARTAATQECDEARLAALTLVDGDGRLMFGVEDAPALRAWPPAAMDRIAAVARRLNGLGVKASEQAAKN